MPQVVQAIICLLFVGVVFRPLSRPFSIPNGYSRIPFALLLVDLVLVFCAPFALISGMFSPIFLSPNP
jgi:hypothetical protein